MEGDGACCTIGGAVGAGWDVFTLIGCMNGITLGAGVAGRVIGGDNGVVIGTSGNIGGNGKIGNCGWFLLRCKICTMTGSSPRCPLWSHYLVHIKNNSYFLGIGPIRDIDLICIYRPFYFLCKLDIR